MDHQCIPQQALHWEVLGFKRGPGRPRTNWRSTVNKDLLRMGITWEEVEVATQNRSEWRRSVAQCGPLECRLNQGNGCFTFVCRVCGAFRPRRLTVRDRLQRICHRRCSCYWMFWKLRTMPGCCFLFTDSLRPRHQMTGELWFYCFWLMMNKFPLYSLMTLSQYECHLNILGLNSCRYLTGYL